MINCIKERFSQLGFQIYAVLQDVFLKAVRKQPFNAELEKVMKFYQSGFEVSLLKTELKVFEEDIRETADLNFTDIVKYRKPLYLGIE